MDDEIVEPFREVDACSLELDGDLYLSVEIVDQHLARPLRTGNVRRVLDRVVEIPAPFDVFAASPKRPAVRLLDDPKEERHATSVDPTTQSGAGPKVPSLRVSSGSRALGRDHSVGGVRTEASHLRVRSCL